LHNHISIKLFDEPISETWDFPNLWAKNAASRKAVALPGPARGIVRGHTVGVDLDAMRKVIAGTKYLYIWGWAEYRDVFPETPQHVTRFAVQVAYVNVSAGRDSNFSMLVHTSGKKIDHKADKQPIDDIFQALADVGSEKFGRAIASLKKIASSLYDQATMERIVDYIVVNRSRYIASL
jgi:hypothetical protein